MSGNSKFDKEINLEVVVECVDGEVLNVSSNNDRIGLKSPIRKLVNSKKDFNLG